MNEELIMPKENPKKENKEKFDSKLMPIENIIPGINKEGLEAIDELDQISDKNEYYAKKAKELIASGKFSGQAESYIFNFVYRILPYNEKIKDRLKDFYKDQIVVDLGAGYQSEGYYLAKELGAKAYIAVEPFNWGNLLSLFHHIDEDQNEFTKLTMPFSLTREDMLTFLKRLPDQSVSVLAAGIDGFMIKDTEYLDEVGKELDRVVKKNMIMIESILPFSDTSFTTEKPDYYLKVITRKGEGVEKEKRI